MKNEIKRYFFWFFGVVCCSLLFYLSYFMLIPTKNSYQEYEELASMGMVDEKTKEQTARENKHERFHIQKDLWMMQEGERLHTRLESDSSEISLVQDPEEEVIEHLKGISCLMQEKISYSDPGQKPMQIVRQIEADEGIYYYHRNLLEAEKVKLSRYLISGNRLPETMQNSQPIMTGTAQSIRMKVDKELHFTAYQFKATFFEEKP